MEGLYMLEHAHRLYSRKQIGGRTAEGIERCTHGNLEGRVRPQLFHRGGGKCAR